MAQLIFLESIGRSERLTWFARTFFIAGFSDFDKVIQRGIDT